MSKEESQTATSIDDNADSDTKQPAETETPSDQPSLSPAAVAFILLGLSLPVFLIALDTSIVATVGIPMNGESNTRTKLTRLCFFLGYSIYHRSISVHKGYWVVWERIFSCAVRLLSSIFLYHALVLILAISRCSLQPLSGKLYATFSLKVSKATIATFMREA